MGSRLRAHRIYVVPHLSYTLTASHANTYALLCALEYGGNGRMIGFDGDTIEDRHSANLNHIPSS